MPTRKAFAETWSPQLASLADLTIDGRRPTAPDGWETLTAGGMSVALDLLGSIDVAAEQARLTKALEVQAKEIKQTGGKLGNAGLPREGAGGRRRRDPRSVTTPRSPSRRLLQARLDRLG